MSILKRLTSVLVLAIFAFACTQEQAAPEDRTEPAASSEVTMSIEAAQEQLTAKLISMPGVTGIAIGECGGKPCVKIMLEKKTQELMAEIPSTYEGFPVIVEETGEIRAQH